MISKSKKWVLYVIYIKDVVLLTFLGRTIPKRRSTHSKIATIISSSSFGAGLKYKETLLEFVVLFVWILV